MWAVRTGLGTPDESFPDNFSQSPREGVDGVGLKFVSKTVSKRLLVEGDFSQEVGGEVSRRGRGNNLYGQAAGQAVYKEGSCSKCR